MGTKEINYFDTPYERRKGNHFMADLMSAVLEDRENNNIIPNNEEQNGRTTN